MPVIEAPVDVAAIPGWQQSADVVVVGLGVAGACAALEAHRAGADVLVIERASAGGGASALSQGIFYFGGGTDVQTACGYEDSPDNMYAFLRAVTTTTDEESLRVYCEDSVAQFDWLEAQGVPVQARGLQAQGGLHPLAARACSRPATRRRGPSATSPSRPRAGTRCPGMATSAAATSR